MDQTLKAGSVELEVAFIDWVKANAYSPTEAIEHFIETSTYVLGAIQAAMDHSRDKVIDLMRQHLARLSEDTVFTAQFPMVYACQNLEGKAMRYTIALTIGDHDAEWIGRVWADDDYLGEVHGSGSGPRANYIELARMQIESHVRCPGDFKPRLRK